ncbi:MAG: hypothetical protein K9N06_11215 [Candidatus Cloacimonetes bacterium]|nr:hypothetical protein [Candidatus Cloacimonadota bacterium]
MTSAKRMIIATLMGAVCGLICISLAQSGGNTLPDFIKLQMIVSRTMIGFVIGISGIKLGWALHGILLGLLIGLPMALASTMGSADSGFTPEKMFYMTLIIGAFYGFLIELVTSVIFKARQKKA